MDEVAIWERIGQLEDHLHPQQNVLYIEIDNAEGGFEVEVIDMTRKMYDERSTTYLRRASAEEIVAWVSQHFLGNLHVMSLYVTLPDELSALYHTDIYKLPQAHASFRSESIVHTALGLDTPPVLFREADIPWKVES